MKHDLQGAQRKLEYETEQRQKAEVKLRDLEEALRVQVAQNNRPQVSDKFEKQVGVIGVRSCIFVWTSWLERLTCNAESVGSILTSDCYCVGSKSFNLVVMKGDSKNNSTD